MTVNDKLAIVALIAICATAVGLTCLLASCARGIVYKEIEDAIMQTVQSDSTAAQTMGDPWCYECKEKCYERKEGTMYHCFHCGKKAVIWDNDYSFEDYCLEGEGIVHELHCTECGATITYFVGEDDADLG